MLDGQQGLITKYLKKETQGSKKAEMSTELAPGIAVLGGDVALSGFGKYDSDLDSGNKEYYDEHNKEQDERFAAAKRVFDQLMQKMFGDIRPLAELEPLLQTPLSGGGMRGSFELAKMELKALKEKEHKVSAKKNDEAVSTYQRGIDSAIHTTGNSMREQSLSIAELARKGEIHDEEIEKSNRDILTLAQILRSLQEKRMESVRLQYGESNSYQNFSPTQLLRLRMSGEKSREAMKGLREKIENFPESNGSSNKAPKESPLVPTRDSGGKTPVIDKGGSAKETSGNSQESEDDRELKEKILLDEIIKNGSVDMYASLPKKTVVCGRELSANGGQGVGEPNNLSGSDYIQRGAMFSMPAGYLGPFAGREFAVGGRGASVMKDKLGIDETVILSQADEPIMKEVVEEVKAGGLKGVFGGKDRVKKMVNSGERRNLSHKELVSGGNDEPAVRFQYSAEAYKRSFKSRDDDLSTMYQDYSGRPGQTLGLECVLPKSVADKLAVKLRENPAFARKLVERLMMSKMGINEKVWRNGEGNGGHPLRPPYEAWANAEGGKSKMYVNLMEKPKNRDDKVGKIVEV